MHLGHEVVHLGEVFGRRVHDEVDALVDEVELGVGDQHRDLDDGVADGVQPRHLEVDPHEPVGHLRSRHGTNPNGRASCPYPRNLTPVSEIVWRPTPESAAASNVGRFMAEHGFTDFADLRARSIAEPEWFWDAFVRFVGIEWSTPYTRCSTPPRASSGRRGSPAAS